MRKQKHTQNVRQVIHIVGEGLTELFYFSHIKNVLLCDSLQSIEYCFLLHYEDTCRHFNDSAATEQALKRYIPTYDKSRKFMEKEKWVKDMIADGKQEMACKLAEKYDGNDSYSGIYKAIKMLSST